MKNHKKNKIKIENKLNSIEDAILDIQLSDLLNIAKKFKFKIVSIV